MAFHTTLTTASIRYRPVTIPPPFDLASTPVTGTCEDHVHVDVDGLHVIIARSRCDLCSLHCPGFPPAPTGPGFLSPGITGPSPSINPGARPTLN